MRAVVQRVTEASVTVADRETARIGPGLLVLLGVAPEDGPRDALWMANKLAGLRVFADCEGRMNLDLEAMDGAMIVVSQFTLYGDCRKGNRPGYSGAALPEQAEPLYLQVVEYLRRKLGEERVGTGVFGAHMDVRLRNDGPVTLIVESPVRTT